MTETGTYQKKAIQKEGGSQTLNDWILSPPPPIDGLELVSVGLPIADIDAALESALQLTLTITVPKRHN